MFRRVAGTSEPGLNDAKKEKENEWTSFLLPRSVCSVQKHYSFFIPYLDISFFLRINRGFVEEEYSLSRLTFFFNERGTSEDEPETRKMWIEAERCWPLSVF